MKRIFSELLEHGDNRKEVWSRLLEEVEALITEHSGTALLQHIPSQASFLTTSERPLPCVPGIIATEFVQLVWLMGAERQKAIEAILQSDRYFAFLRITPWATILRLGYGLIFALGQAVCASIPAPEGDADAAAAALRSHSAWPGSVPTEATVFKQFHRLAGFDYRACAHRFLGYHGPADCAGPRGGRARSASGHAWPHRQLAQLAARQPWACGVACRWAVAFADLAQALLEQKRGSLSKDQLKLLQAAQDEFQQVEAAIWAMPGPTQVAASCSLARSFPVWTLLARLARLPPKLSALLPITAPPPLRFPNQPPPPTLAKLCDRVQWPLEQRLTPQGSLAVYFLVETVGRLLDEFGVKWWMSSGALLGTMRHGGMLPQDCDVDIAIWRPDAQPIVLPAFRTALMASGIAMYHMPIYFQYRFCLVQVPAAADERSVDGGLACHLPYVDAHLADMVSGDEWHYIHRTELKYAHSFSLDGLMRWSERGFLEDRRQRRAFGSATVWTPQANQAELYLNQIYGRDWKTAVRGRYGALVYNASDAESFQGQIARPSGPLRDVIQEQRRIGNLLPGAAVDCTHACDL